MSEFTKLGGYLVEGQPEVAHDSALSGNGLPESPLGISEQFITDVVRPQTQSAFNLNIGHTENNTVAQVGATIGSDNIANNTGFAVGTDVSATNKSIAAGDNVRANQNAIAVGRGVRADQIAAFGTYNSVMNTGNGWIFVVGNGTDSANRSDAFKINKDGRVEAANFVTPNNVQLSALTGVLKETGFGYDSNNKISGYNGSGFAGGATFPASAEEACEAVTANSATWNGKQDTLTFGYNASNAISSINESAIAAGTELEFEYDAADNISAINNSAISTTPAQDLYAKSPLYFDVTGTSSYMGINTADLARMLGVDETVLWSGNVDTKNGTAIQLSESLANFNRIKIEMMDKAGWNNIYREINPTAIGTDNTWKRNIEFVFHTVPEAYNNTQYSRGMSLRAANGSATVISAYGYEVQSNGGNANSASVMIRQVIGIGRKEV